MNNTNSTYKNANFVLIIFSKFNQMLIFGALTKEEEIKHVQLLLDKIQVAIL